MTILSTDSHCLFKSGSESAAISLDSSASSFSKSLSSLDDIFQIVAMATLLKQSIQAETSNTRGAYRRESELCRIASGLSLPRK